MSKMYGILASYSSPAELIHAAEKMRDAGYTKFDCHSPFPIHGMDDAMGLKPSPLGFIATIGALCVGGSAIALQWWCSTQAYGLVLSGKPLWSYQAFVPITFELSILGAALFTVFGMFAINKLPTLYHPLFNSKKFEAFSDDGFFISVDCSDQKFELKQTSALLQSAGGKDIEVIEEQE